MRLDLVPELADVNAESLRIDRRGPELIEKEAMREHLSRMLYHDSKQVIFLWRELDFLAAHFDDTTYQIDGQIAKFEDRMLALYVELVPQRRPDAGEQFLHAERLGHVIVGSLIERLDLGRLIAPTGQYDDRQVCSPGADLAQQLEALHVRSEEHTSEL